MHYNVLCNRCSENKEITKIKMEKQIIEFIKGYRTEDREGNEVVYVDDEELLIFAKMLIEAISVTRCCETLNNKEVIPFEDWRKENCTHLDGDLYSFKQNVFDSYDLRYVYMRECKQSL